jgi:hypothetical protein
MSNKQTASNLYLKLRTIQQQDQSMARTLREVCPFVGALEYGARTGVLRMKINASKEISK